jgi:hypothetical protein
MIKNTIHQIILFIITAFLIFKTGKLVFALNDLNSFKDFAIVMIFFISLIFFINYLAKLMSKFRKIFSF